MGGAWETNPPPVFGKAAHPELNLRRGLFMIGNSTHRGYMLKHFSTKDLIVIATLAAIGIAVKPIIGPLFKMISTPLMIPGGSFAGGFYMLWLCLAVFMVGKPGAGTLFGVVQALIVLVAGLQGNQGALGLVSYPLPGIVADLLFAVLKDGSKTLHHILICAWSNLTGALVVAIMLFGHPIALVLIIGAMALVSGAVGGLLSKGIYIQLKRYGIIQ